MSTSKEGEVISPIEFRIRGLEVKAEEIRLALQLLLEALGLQMVRSVTDPTKIMVISANKKENESASR